MVRTAGTRAADFRVPSQIGNTKSTREWYTIAEGNRTPPILGGLEGEKNGALAPVRPAKPTWVRFPPAILMKAALLRAARRTVEKGEGLMELRSNIKLLNYTRKFLLNDTDDILPYDIRPQKPSAAGKTPRPLPRVAPGDEGVPCGALDALLRGLSGAAGGTHTCLVLRRGRVVCEAEYAPYSIRRWHVTHSMCKSVTGAAIGMLIGEGLLSVDDHICDIFPEKCSLLTSRRMRAVTVRHLLSMRSGVSFRETGSVLESDWVKAFLDADVLFEPGEAFDYNSMNSYMLSAIVRKKTGEGLADYLRPRLFEPLGFGDVAWETCPQGIAKGGWGMYVYLEDLAKLGQLYLQKGLWTDGDGAPRRLLSEEWIAASTTPYSTTEKGEEYGYQLWPHSADGVYLFNGMFGQYVVVAPAQELVVAVNAGAANLFVLSESFAAITRFVHAVAEAPGGPDAPDAEARLAFTLAHLRFAEPVPPMPEPVRTPWYARLRGLLSAKKTPDAPSLIPDAVRGALAREYPLHANRAGLVPTIVACMEDWYTKGVERVAFEQSGGGLTLLWRESGVLHRVPVGLDGEARECVLDFGGNLFVVGTTGRFTTDEDDNPVLKLTLCFLESSSSRLVKLIFLPDGTLTVKLDESPALLTAMESLRETMKAASPGMEVFKDLDYLQYLASRACTPVLHAE